MGSTQGAIDAFEKTRASAKDAKDVCWYAPGKAANAGGVGELIISLPLSFVFRLSWRRLLIAFDRSLFPSHLSSAVSGLEMSQNSARIKWTREEVDSKYVGPLSISILRSSKEPLTDLRLLRLLSLSLSLSLSLQAARHYAKRLPELLRHRSSIPRKPKGGCCPSFARRWSVRVLSSPRSLIMSSFS
jgi:hypothetical protein